MRAMGRLDPIVKAEEDRGVGTRRNIYGSSPRFCC